MDLLSENFDNVYLEDAQGHESRLGSEKMSVWKRKNWLMFDLWRLGRRWIRVFQFALFTKQ